MSAREQDSVREGTAQVADMAIEVAGVQWRFTAQDQCRYRATGTQGLPGSRILFLHHVDLIHAQITCTFVHLIPGEDIPVEVTQSLRESREHSCPGKTLRVVGIEDAAPVELRDIRAKRSERHAQTLGGLLGTVNVRLGVMCGSLWLWKYASRQDGER